METSTPGTDLLQCWDEVRVREDEEEILYVDPARTREVPGKVTLQIPLGWDLCSLG